VISLLYVLNDMGNLQVGSEDVEDQLLESGEQIELRQNTQVVSECPRRISYSPTNKSDASPNSFITITVS